jgi:hypothetical protein
MSNSSSENLPSTKEAAAETKLFRESLPKWVDDELIRSTIETWQPYYDEPLTVLDAIQMILNVSRLGESLRAS